MPRNTSSTALYRDIIDTLDTVLGIGIYPAMVPCASRSAATVWRQRANTLRVRLRRQEEEAFNLPNGQGTCRFDSLIFTQNEGMVVINQRPTVSTVIVDGQSIPVQRSDQLEIESAAEEIIPDADDPGNAVD